MFKWSKKEQYSENEKEEERQIKGGRARQRRRERKREICNVSCKGRRKKSVWEREGECERDRGWMKDGKEEIKGERQWKRG
jgi:hypothetical protein